MNTTLPPLAVDLDGTLVLTDTLHESVLALLRRSPLYLLLIPIWLLGGKAHFKRQVSRRVTIDPVALPYNVALLDWLRSQRDQRELLLCTAADATIADAIARHTGLFAAVLASDGRHNLSGEGKAQALVERYGERGFDYAGNAGVDLAVWRRARAAVVVNAGDKLLRAARMQGPVAHVVARSGSGAGTWIRALRLHQWAKNLLIFVPLLTAHLAFDFQAIAQALLAFLAFGLCASSVYLVNDLFDLDADRQHPRKRLRPFAAGQLSLRAGMILAPALFAASFALAGYLLPLQFVVVLLAYYALTLAYSLLLKRIEMLDVVVLAALYTTRIVAGTFALAVPLSFWLLAFSVFLFLSLALVKRHTELSLMRDRGRDTATGRGYSIDDLPMIGALGAAAGYLAVLVLALYIQSPESQALYRQPELLWLLCPILLYWISRVWLLTHRGRMHDDPVMFALQDRTSLLVFVLAIAAVALAI